MRGLSVAAMADTSAVAVRQTSSTSMASQAWISLSLIPAIWRHGTDGFASRRAGESLLDAYPITSSS